MANLSTTSSAPQAAFALEDIPAGPHIDFATLIGVAGAFVMIATAMYLGGSPGAFIDVPALVIVVGGSFLVTSISFSAGEVLRAQGVMMKSVIYHAYHPGAAAAQVLYLAGLSRRNGILSMQKLVPELEGQPFLHRSIRLVIDGTPAEQVEALLDSEVHAMADRHTRSAAVLRRAGEVCPAMGLIGTLIGLVQMLGNLQDPESIGPAMAVALLTTFYGAVLANMVFLPLANKLDRNSAIESMVNRIYALGAVSIARQENPRRLEILLDTILPPGDRLGE